ncbi:MAG: M43 family zinc metalloprotease [Ferruginibacter sp.]
MRKLYAFLLVVFVMLFTTTVNAQTLEPTKDGKKPVRAALSKQSIPSNNAPVSTIAPHKKEKCGFSYMMQKAKARGYDERAFENQVKQLIERRVANGERFTGPVTLPVVFHVIYRNADGTTPSTSTANLAFSKFQAQINQLNIDYANLAGSTWGIPGVAADMQLRFCLAVVDTAGRPFTNAAEPGIDRINGQTKGWSDTDPMTDVAVQDYFDTLIKPRTIWDPYSYINIWTTSMTTSGLLGYSTFPTLSGLTGLDETETIATAGVVVNWESVGSVASPGVGAPYNQGKTLTHELGHFFGLRHIWGDDVCGDDYCADTPSQDAETSGCPSGSQANNCIPAGNKMYQNYMDYTDDACMNTFTLNQATRSQTAMDNSPRRLALISSKACTARAGNAIGFSTAIPYAITETGPAGACPNVKTFQYRVYVSSAATGNATVNFTLSGTATNNRDYTISPASASYTNGDNSVKTITVTIIDDQAVEADETITLGYTISGTGVVAGPDKQSVTLVILDDDVNFTVDNTTSVKTLVSENFNASANIPSGWVTEVYGDGVTTPNQWVVGANGGTGTTGNSAYITSNTTTKPLSYNTNNASDAYLFSPLIDATGLKNLNLTFKWKSNGEAGYDGGFLGYIPYGQTVTAANVQYFNVFLQGVSTLTTSSLNFGSGFNDSKFYFVFNWYNDNTTGSNPPFTIEDVSFTAKALTIATTTDADTAFAQYTGQTAQFYSVNANSPNDTRIIASIASLSGDIGCITASVPQAGGTSASLSLYTTTGVQTKNRLSKVVKITPASANTTATYQVTLYYTTAELAVLGIPLTQYRVLKVSDAASLATTLGSSNAAQFTPTVDDQRATKGYAAFTINATGGFSQFVLFDAGAGIVIPVELISFEARPNGKNILLNWSTATEHNNKGFVIERSVNGVDFQKIGWVDGRINSDLTSNYTYKDNFVQPNIVYYYRLRQTDLDSREKLSDIRQAKIKDDGVVVSVSPNPAKDQLKVFVSGSSDMADISLVNAEGQMVRGWKKVNVTGAPATLDISNLPAGVYMIRLLMPQSTTVQKLIIR